MLWISPQEEEQSTSFKFLAWARKMEARKIRTGKRMVDSLMICIWLKWPELGFRIAENVERRSNQKCYVWISWGKTKTWGNFNKDQGITTNTLLAAGWHSHKTAVLEPLMSHVNVFDIVVPHANNCIDIIVMQIQTPQKSIHISFSSNEKISQEEQDHEEIVFKQFNKSLVHAFEHSLHHNKSQTCKIVSTQLTSSE